MGVHGKYPTLADRLKTVRAQSFVGRCAEIELFGQALRADPAPFSLLWLHGPGGIGKSALVQRLADEAQASGAHPVLLDAATIEATAPALREAVAAHLGGPADGRLVLLIDTAERLDSLQDWLRTEFLPGLPGDTLIVVAGRRPPGSRWRSDLGWSQQLRTISVPGLTPAQARDYLVQRGVPEADLPAVLARTHGHPLALALVSDVWNQRIRHRVSGSGLRPDDFRDVVTALLERFLDDIPDPVHRRALHVLGHARVTTQHLLLAVVGPERAEECFDWLCRLSFVNLRSDGIAPHELAREVLDDDLRWRDHAAWSDLHRQIRAVYAARMVGGSGADQARATADLLWFHRRSPALSAYRSWDDAFSLWVQPAQDADLPQILELVDEHEGSDSLDLHRAWWRHQRAAFFVVRSPSNPVHGFLVQLALPACVGGDPGEADDPAEADGVVDGGRLARAVGDPVAIAAWQLVARSAPLRPGEHLRVIRSWFGRDGYHEPSPTHQALTGLITRMCVSEPGLAVSVGYAVNPALWTPMYGHIDYARAEDGDAVVGPHSFAAYLHDWRVTSPLAWLDLLESRECAGAEDPERAVLHARRHLSAQSQLALSRPDFEKAVREAFRDATRPDELARNPLLCSRLFRAHLESGARPQAEDLRALLNEQVVQLRQSSRREVAARVLELTYLGPTRTQQAAATRLALPFSTYRRHLSAGLVAVTDRLWERELSGG